MLFEQKETDEEEEDAEDEEDEAGLAVMTSISVEIIIPSSGRDSLLADVVVDCWQRRVRWMGFRGAHSLGSKIG